MASKKRSHDDYKDDDESSLESNDSDASTADDYGARTGSNTTAQSKPSRQDRRRESNRLSKRRCRKQRKEMVMTLETQIRGLAQEQKDLKAENDALRKELLDNVLELQKKPEENAQESAKLPSPPGKSKTAEAHLSPQGAPHELSVKNPASMGLMVPSPRRDAGQNVSFLSQSLNVAGVNSYQGTSVLAPAITGAQNNQIASIPSDTSNSLNILDMISLLTKNSPQVQNPAYSVGRLPAAQAAGNQPAADQLIAASQNVLPFLSFSNPRYDAGMAWMARFAAAQNLVLNQNAASRPTLTFPNDQQSAPYFSGSQFHLPPGQQDSDQKWPARK